MDDGSLNLAAPKALPKGAAVPQTCVRPGNILSIQEQHLNTDTNSMLLDPIFRSGFTKPPNSFSLVGFQTKSVARERSGLTPPPRWAARAGAVAPPGSAPVASETSDPDGDFRDYVRIPNVHACHAFPQGT